MHKNIAFSRIKFQNFLMRSQDPSPVGRGIPHTAQCLRSLGVAAFGSWVPLLCLLVQQQLHENAQKYSFFKDKISKISNEVPRPHPCREGDTPHRSMPSVSWRRRLRQLCAPPLFAGAAAVAWGWRCSRFLGDRL